MIALHFKEFFAIITHFSNQPLGQHTNQSGLQQKVRDPQIEHAHDGRRRIVGMQGGENQMPCQRCLYSVLSRFQVAHLSDHDDIRVLSQYIAKYGTECNTDLLLHGDLDTDVPYEQSLMMSEALSKRGIENKLITMRGRGHGFDGDASVAQVALDAVLAFLQAHL